MTDNRADQAGELRRMVTDVTPRKTSTLHTLTIMSGKGGVGKSNIAAGLAFALADYGRRVVLVDADLGMANLDILCGIRNARWNISHLIDGSRNLSEILVHFKLSQQAERNNGSVSLLPGGVGLTEIADLDEFAMLRLLDALSELEGTADWLIMDAGAGIHECVLSFAYASEGTIVITTPEPTSVRDAYGVIKSLGTAAWEGERGKGLMLAVNMVSSTREALEVAERIRSASAQFLGNMPVYLGAVMKDPVVEKAVRECKVFYRTAPYTEAAICIKNIAGELLRIFDGLKTDNIQRDKNKDNSHGFFRRLREMIFASKSK